MSIAFVKAARLREASLSAPILRVINAFTTLTYGVWEVPITITDSRGITRSFVRSYIAINRDSRLEGSLVLLS
jgi:hypothetical protein